MTTLCFLISVLIPRLATGIFTHDPELLDIASKGLTLQNMAFPIVGFQMIATNFFQSLGMVKKSVLLSLSRQILFLLPLLYLLPLKFGGNGVWYSFPISDVIAFILTAILLGQLFKKFSRLKDGEDPTILGSNL